MVCALEAKLKYLYYTDDDDYKYLYYTPKDTDLSLTLLVVYRCLFLWLSTPRVYSVLSTPFFVGSLPDPSLSEVWRCIGVEATLSWSLMRDRYHRNIVS
jgi:hypothetical protein